MSNLPLTNLTIDAIHQEIGGTTETQVSLNDSDVRAISVTDSDYDGGDGINTTNESTIAMGEFRNAINASLSGWPSGIGNDSPVFGWGTMNYSNTGFSQVVATWGVDALDETNDRIVHKSYTQNSGSASSFTYAYQSYSGLDGGTLQVNMSWSVSTGGTGGVARQSAQPPSSQNNSWEDATNFGKLYTWSVTMSSGSGSSTMEGDATFKVRILKDSVYYPSTSGYSSSQQTIGLSAFRGTGGGGGL